MSNPRPLVLDDPLSIDEARAASRAAANQRRAVEALHEQRVEEAAAKERDYRKRLARAFVEATGNTAAHREANARSIAADAAYARDLAVGMVKATGEQLRGLEGERAMLRVLIDWSQRLHIDGRERMPA